MLYEENDSQKQYQIDQENWALQLNQNMEALRGENDQMKKSTVTQEYEKSMYSLAKTVEDDDVKNRQLKQLREKVKKLTNENKQIVEEQEIMQKNRNTNNRNQLRSPKTPR